MALFLTTFKAAGRSTKIVVNHDAIEHLEEIAGGTRTKIHFISGHGVDVEGDIAAVALALAVQAPV